MIGTTKKKKNIVIVSGDEDANGLIEHFIIVIDERLTAQDEKRERLEKDMDKRMSACETKISTLEVRLAIYVIVAVTVIAMAWQVLVKVFK